MRRRYALPIAVLALALGLADAQTIKHRFHSPVPDAGDPDEVGPDEWNDSAVVEGGSDGSFFMRDSGSTDGWKWATPRPTSTPANTPVPTATVVPTPTPRPLFGSAPGAKNATTDLSGDPTTDNCVKWIAGGKLGDAGAACGTITNPTPHPTATPLPAVYWIPGAACQNATAGALWDLPTASATPGPAVAACVTGTNIQKGVLDYADSVGLSVQMTLRLPANYNESGTTSVMLKWLTSATSGDVQWLVATSCVADAETDDPSWNTASTVADTAKGTTLQTNDATISSLTMTGCNAGELLHVRVARDATAGNGSDTLAATARLIGVEITVPRS